MTLPLPRDWKRSSLSSVIDLISGQHIQVGDCNTDGRGVPYLTGPSDFENGQIRGSKFTEAPQVCCKVGDILLTVKGSGTGSIAIADREYCISRQLMAVRPKNVDPTFIRFVLESHSKTYNAVSAGLIPGIARDDVLNTRLDVPPLAEQRKIGQLLLTWSAAIDKTERLIAAKERHFSGFVRRLIIDRASSEASWKRVPIHEIAERIQRQTDGGSYPLLTISSASGFVRQEEKYSRYMAGESAKTYTLLRAGEFAYNKGNSLRYEFGCIFQLQDYEAALVPSVYVSFRLHDSVCASYMRHLFTADYLKSQLRALVKTGVRNNGLLNIRPDEFMGTTVPMPPFAEQERISKVLDTARLEIALLTKQLVALRNQKHGLMQKLLTGQWRVKVPEGAEVA